MDSLAGARVPVIDHDDRRFVEILAGRRQANSVCGLLSGPRTGTVFAPSCRFPETATEVTCSRSVPLDRPYPQGIAGAAEIGLLAAMGVVVSAATTMRLVLWGPRVVRRLDRSPASHQRRRGCPQVMECPSTKGRLLGAAVALAFGVSSPAVRADPPLSSLGRAPVCGDAGEGTAELRCRAFEPVPDIEVFRVPGEASAALHFDFVFSEANRPNELAVFRVDDQRGVVEGLSPVEPGYVAAALRRATVIFVAGADPSVEDAVVRARGGELLAFVIVHDGSVRQVLSRNPTNDSAHRPNAYFSIRTANPDPDTPHGGDHMVGFVDPGSGLTQFAFEDLSAFSDWDFDDLVYTVSARLERPRCEGPDVDSDGIPDVCDTCPVVADPGQADADGDLIGDACDNCLRSPNFSQADSDGGRGDSCSLERCSDGRDNDGNGLVDGSDPWCSALRITRVAQPLAGTRSGRPASARGTGFSDGPGFLEVGSDQVPATRWRARAVRFTVPDLEPGVDPLPSWSARPDRATAVSSSIRGAGGGMRSARRAVSAIVGNTSWWRVFDEVRRADPRLANPFRLRVALDTITPHDGNLVVQAVSGLDATTYGAAARDGALRARVRFVRPGLPPPDARCHVRRLQATRVVPGNGRDLPRAACGRAAAVPITPRRVVVRPASSPRPTTRNAALCSSGMRCRRRPWPGRGF